MREFLPSTTILAKTEGACPGWQNDNGSKFGTVEKIPVTIAAKRAVRSIELNTNIIRRMKTTTTSQHLI